jgi:hypothetical protein
VNPTHPASDKPGQLRVSKAAVVLLLIILSSMALLAVYANVQRWRRNQVETVIVKPTNPPSTPEH